MSEQQSQADRPATTTDTKQEGPDDSEPTPEWQAELRAAYEANVAAGKVPYKGVGIRTRGELRWVLQERRWSGDIQVPEGYESANLSGAHLEGAKLSGANLSGADLYNANLSGAHLRGARMDATTLLRSAHLDTHTRLADVVWNGAPLTRLNWQDIARLGDEQAARNPKAIDGMGREKAARLQEYTDAVLANRQVATVLRSQGLNEHADRFAFRAQVCQRRVLRMQRHYLRYLGSLLLGLISGYGYRPLRSFATYVLVVLAFAGAYLLNAQFAAPHLRWDEALVLSISAFHGRGFFTTGISLGDTLARLAAGEAIIGLLIEITFIATFTQRFFAR